MKRPRQFRIFAISMLTAATVWAVPPGNQSELLDVEQAFQASVRFADAHTIEVTYQIADGYYMYRDRFQFTNGQGKPAFGNARIPSGKMKEDATFGRVEIYRGSVRVLLRLVSEKLDGAALGEEKSIAILATSQGCADAGVCYPPQQHSFRLERGSTATVHPMASKVSEFSSTGQQSQKSGHLRPPGSLADLIKKAQ